MYSYIIIINCAAISYNMIQGSLPISWAIDPQLGEEFPVRNSPPQLLTCPDLTWPGLAWPGLVWTGLNCELHIHNGIGLH
jgi:hypothetical protein